MNVSASGTGPADEGDVAAGRHREVQTGEHKGQMGTVPHRHACAKASEPREMGRFSRNRSAARKRM